MAAWVLLRHDLPDGSWHYDWMLESPGEPALTTFRVTDRPDDPAVARFGAERIGGHRRDYLTYEGPVSGNRGFVRRIAAGTCRVEADDHHLVVALVEAEARWIGTPASIEGRWYSFERAATVRERNPVRPNESVWTRPVRLP